MTINELTNDVHKNAVAHGWWEEPRSFGEVIALCHSELSEALEEDRDGVSKTLTYYSCKANKDSVTACSSECDSCPYGKPEGIPSELADCVIRILDACGYYGINLEAAIIEKHEFNKARPYKHGKKY